MLTALQLSEARLRIAPYVYHTPVIEQEAINTLSGARVFFKCENLQKIGAFKARGAFNMVLQLTAAERSCGVATHSSGNHAQALALAAKTLGLKAYIVMPEGSPEAKKKGVRNLGAEIFFCENSLEARERTLQQVMEKTGAVFIPPYNDLRIIAGQASAAAEYLELHPDTDFLLAPVGGGGLLSGTALSAAYLSPHTKVIGCEPENMNDAYRSFTEKKWQGNPAGVTSMADGLRTTLGDITFGIICEIVHAIYTVSEQEIADAWQLAWEMLKLIIEPSSAVPLAVLLKYPQIFSGKKVGIIFSGGNVDYASVPFLKG